MLQACARPLLIPSAEPNGRRASVQEPLATWDKTNILPYAHPPAVEAGGWAYGRMLVLSR
jgi:hypothetical protein